MVLQIDDDGQVLCIHEAVSSVEAPRCVLSDDVSTWVLHE